MRIALLVGQPDPDRVIAGGAFAIACELVVAQIGLLIAFEVHVHRIQRYHGGQQRGIGLGQIALGDHRAPGAAIDRRPHLGELQIQPRAGDRGFGGIHAGVALRGGGLARFEFLARDRLGFEQRLGADVLGLRQARFAARARQVGLGAIEFGAVTTLVDHEQQVAFLDLLAFAISDAFDITADARTQLDRFHRADAAGEIVPLANRLGQHRGDADFGRGRRRFAGRCLAAARGDGRCDQCAQRERSDRVTGARTDLEFIGSVHRGEVPGYV